MDLPAFPRAGPLAASGALAAVAAADLARAGLGHGGNGALVVLGALPVAVLAAAILLPTRDGR